MTPPLFATLCVAILGLGVNVRKVVMGIPTDPLAWIFIVGLIVAIGLIAHENRAPRRPRPKPSSDRMAVGE